MKHYLLLMGQLNRWLLAEGLGLEGFTPSIGQQFLDSRRAAGRRRVPTMVSLAPLIACFDSGGILAEETVAKPTPLDELLSGYRHHLVHDRGLTVTTVRRYEWFARRFLVGRAARTGTETGTDSLTSAEVTAYMLGVSGRLTIESAEREAADLRALLRYLYVASMLEVDLGTAMQQSPPGEGRRCPRR